MKVASYQRGKGASYGVVREGYVVDCGDSLRGRFPTLRTLLAAGALVELPESGETTVLSELTLLPVIPNPERILFAGLNYQAHVEEEKGRAPPDAPRLHARLTSSLAAHGQALIKPRVSDEFDFEGELAVIIGKPGRHIAAESALSHVAGYSCFLDGSIRDFQKHTITAGKNFPATGPLGPWMVTTDEIPDPQALELTTRLNGEVVQHGHTRDMIHSVAEIIAYCSAFTPLSPGDVISTGTPEGVGARRTPPLWMRDGDVVEVTISAIGTLRNPIMAEA